MKRIMGGNFTDLEGSESREWMGAESSGLRVIRRSELSPYPAFDCPLADGLGGENVIECVRNRRGQCGGTGEARR